MFNTPITMNLKSQPVPKVVINLSEHVYLTYPTGIYSNVSLLISPRHILIKNNPVVF